METMSPQQENIGQRQSPSVAAETKIFSLPQSKKMKKTLALRRQSAPSLVITKALSKSRSISRERCLSPLCPETCPLVQSFLIPPRVFVAHSSAQLQTGMQTQDRHLFLFNDLLLITKAKSSSHFKLKSQVRVSEMWTAGCMEEVCEGSTSPERSFVVGWPVSNCVATFGSIEQKQTWLSLIESRMKEEKERDDPKSIPLKVFAKDIENCAPSQTLAVSNSDTATDVIRMALQNFGISASVRDYQLWVSSSRDNAPYPLIGHEFPFSIKANHIREPLSQTEGKNAVTPPDLQRALLLDQQPLDSQCQFILKPSRTANGQSVLELGQKTVKRKRSVLNWAFWRGSTTQLDGLLASPPSPTPGRLFGLPLSTVCRQGALPKPVMDMLSFLFYEGPFTRGIFRRSASAKACRELRDMLNSGAQDIPLTSESIFVTAVVFKDFLRNIPGSLLSQDHYDQWVEVMDRVYEDEKERLQAVQRLVCQLPPDNLLLLRHVLAVLHCIHRHADDNQMNAFNLSVCIAPSMLWSPVRCSPEVEGQGTRKVSKVVQFLIENCCRVLEDDIIALFGGFPQKCSSSDQGSDVSSFQMNDSSYDSLENELNDDAEECPFQDLRRHRDKSGHWSRDSVITLSDCDPEPDSVHPQRPPAVRSGRFAPDLPPCCPRPPCDVSGRQPLRGARKLRRCSEPAIGHSPPSPARALERQPFVLVRKASYDGVTDRSEKEQEVEEKEEARFVERLSDLQLEQREKGSRGSLWRAQKQPATLCLDTSCSSLSSPAVSPSASSMSSLDSAFSQHSADLSAFVPADAASAPILSLKSVSSPKESYDWNQHRTAHGLHPNSWLKSDRQLSLRPRSEPDHNPLAPNGLPASSGSSQECKPKAQESAGQAVQSSGCPPTYQQALLQEQHRKAKGSTVTDLRQRCRPAVAPGSTGNYITHQSTAASGKGRRHPPQGLFYGQGASCLILRRQTPCSLRGSPAGPALLRRASEPALASLDGAPAAEPSGLCGPAPAPEGCMSLSRDPQHCGLRVSDVDLVHDGVDQNLGPRFCLSPSATRAVTDYFSLHVGPETSLRRSQEVATALYQGKREWQNRRCSDPRFEDFDQMLFAEESYV